MSTAVMPVRNRPGGAAILDQRVQNALREIETEAYRPTLDLADIEIAETCDVCPLAPPTTKLQVHLIVLADVLEQ